MLAQASHITASITSLLRFPILRHLWEVAVRRAKSVTRPLSSDSRPPRPLRSTDHLQIHVQFHPAHAPAIPSAAQPRLPTLRRLTGLPSGWRNP